MEYFGLSPETIFSRELLERHAGAGAAGGVTKPKWAARVVEGVGLSVVVLLAVITAAWASTDR
jgi:hypothetical protein